MGKRIMARIDTTPDPLTEEVFHLAQRHARTSADQRAIDTEHDLEILYQIRLARRRSSVFTGSTSNAVVLRMAGWE